MEAQNTQELQTPESDSESTTEVESLETENAIPTPPEIPKEPEYPIHENEPYGMIDMHKVGYSYKNGYCGYCKQNGTTKLNIKCNKMDPETYDKMFQMGWNRCQDSFYLQDPF